MKRVNPLPTILTLCNMICGFGSMTLAMRATQYAALPDAARTVAFNHKAAAGLIFLAMVFDVLDGRVARMAGLTSRFGAELDSLSDIVSFGIAPAFLAKSMLDIGDWPPLVVRGGWMMLALYVAAAAVRLARYNVEAISPTDGKVGAKGKDYFVGLPSPAAAGMAVSPVLLYYLLTAKEEDGFGIEAKWILLFLPLLFLLMAWLMVSRVRYMHIGNKLFVGKQKLWAVMLVMVTLIIGASFWKIAGTVLFGGYVLGFLFWDLGRRARSARTRRKMAVSGETSAPAGKEIAGRDGEESV